MKLLNQDMDGFVSCLARAARKVVDVLLDGLGLVFEIYSLGIDGLKSNL